MKHDVSPCSAQSAAPWQWAGVTYKALAGGIFGQDSLQEQSPAAGRWLEEDQTWLPFIPGVAASLSLGFLGCDCIWGNGMKFS